jgi:hypothetical protein
LTFLAAVLSGSSNSSTLNDVEPGVLGFLVVAALVVALVFLLRSMNKQFRKLGPPPEESAETDADGGEPTPGADSGAGDATVKGAKRR